MKRLKNSLHDTSRFTVVVELSSGPGHNVDLFLRFLEDYQNAGQEAVPAVFDFAAITAAQNPGGVASLDPSVVLARLNNTDLLNDLDFIPHLSCKDLNSDALLSSLIGYRQAGVESILALTGDKPLSGQGVFEVESVGLLQMIVRHNRQTILKAKPNEWDQAHQFYAGAAVSPFKYTEPSLMQQYYKMEKKIAAGAEFLVTQVGWDWKKSLELLTYLKHVNLNIPVIGDVFVLTTGNSAYRRMYEGQLPGCYVSNALFERLRSESRNQQIERAAQQVAMYRALGAAGVDLGGIHDFQTISTLLLRAAEIGEDWVDTRDNLYFPPEKTFYLYDEKGQSKVVIPTQKTLRHRCFDLMHKLLLDPEHPGFHLFKKTMALLGTEKKTNGAVAHAFTAIEHAFKKLAFQCEGCGDCYLVENFGYCTLGGCKKGLPNSPCGDATVDGMCGNDPTLVCRGEHIYLAAKAEPDGIDKLRHEIHPPRNPDLCHSASILNYLFGRDHTRQNALISIADALHGGVPKVGRIMKALAQEGDTDRSVQGGLAYLRALVEDQIADGADYILINVDTLGHTHVTDAAQAMSTYVRLVRDWGDGVPVCIDSQYEPVLLAGLQAWYESNVPVAQPLIRPVPLKNADNILALKKDYDFSFIVYVSPDDQPDGPSHVVTVDEQVHFAYQYCHKAVTQYGFQAPDIFFSLPCPSLGYDISLIPGTPSYTYRSFHTIKRIMSDPRMKGVHCCMEIQNCCQDLKVRQTGICRAFVAKAVEYGLDAGIVTASHRYGHKPADPELVTLIDAFANADGSMERAQVVATRMSQFCIDARDLVTPPEHKSVVKNKSHAPSSPHSQQVMSKPQLEP